MTSKVEVALKSLVDHYESLRGPRAHMLGCECAGSNDGIHSCSTLKQAVAASLEILSDRQDAARAGAGEQVKGAETYSRG